MKASRFNFILVSILILVDPLYCFSQTNLGISLGVDFAEIRAAPNQVGFEILENGYSSESLFWGLRIEQKVSTSIFLSLQGTYTKKKIDATDKGFVPFKRLEYKEIKTSFAVNWIPFSTFSVGGGMSHSFIPSVKKIRNIEPEEITGGRREFGGIVYISYLYNDFLLELNYYHGLDVVSTTRKSNSIEPIKAVGVSLSYIFRVFEKRKGKKSSHLRI
jgi:hypothetical protein